MIAEARWVDRGDEPQRDQYVQLRGVSWADYLQLVEIRGDRPRPRIAFFRGTLELMSTSRTHEQIKSCIGRLVETWCLERGVEFMPYGGWTLQDEDAESAAEADECYIFGVDPQRKRRPELAIEVVLTSGGIDKLEIYHRLRVREVWFWKNGAIRVYLRRARRYAAVAASAGASISRSW
jgi:Uma2 family endonuclease